MILLSLCFLLLPLCTAYNYCNNDTDYCKMEGKIHFICRRHQELPPLMGKAQFEKRILDTYALRQIILDTHNDIRNQLAGGEVKTSNNKQFKPASRMRELIWDTELGYTAFLHASTVSFKHSLCRSVLRFPFTGESLGLVFASTHRRTIKEILKHTIGKMFLEYEDVPDPDELMNKFDVTKHNDFGHFSLIISDRVSRVGCAIVAASNCDKQDTAGYCHFLTCHYDFTNLQDSFVYLNGDSTSRCSDWSTDQSSTYKHLCENKGKIFPKDHGHAEKEEKPENAVLRH